MNYLYGKIEEDANFHLYSPERKAFREHLDKVIKALHDIEWVDSCDYSKGSENLSIMACITDTALLESAIKTAKVSISELQEIIARCELLT